jgi:hypothetical protein
MTRAAQIIPYLARGREAIDQLYERIVRSPKILCAALDGYRAVRAKQLFLEGLIVAEARAAGIHPPEDVPRSFAEFGACAPGEIDSTLAPEARKAAVEYLQLIAKRRAATDAAFAKMYGANPAFKARVDQLLPLLVPLGTVQGSRLAPLRLIYFVGGTPWAPDEAEKLLALELRNASLPATLRLLRETQTLDAALSDLSKLSGAPEAKPSGKRSPWLIAAGVVGTAVAITGTALLVRHFRRDDGRHDEGYVGELPETETASPSRDGQELVDFQGTEATWPSRRDRK